jgi:hypothetical protein
MEAAGELLFRSGEQMTRRLSTWLVLVALGATVLAGCGGGGSSSTSANQSGSTATTTSSTVKTTATTVTVPSNIPITPGAVGQAVAVCKSIIDRAPTLSSSTRAKVEAICNKAAHGDEAGARAAAKGVCAEVIDASPIPAAAKAQALAACKRSS